MFIKDDDAAKAFHPELIIAKILPHKHRPHMSILPRYMAMIYPHSCCSANLALTLAFLY